tara:strand:- start:4763 stop:4984 length:222 start_codon:yes stop_codon:yes gene_type:complete
MIKPGDLFQHLGNDVIIEVLRTYNYRDIDPECVESVAIIGMIEVVILSGGNIGKKTKYSRKHFWQKFLKLESK